MVAREAIVTPSSSPQFLVLIEAKPCCSMRGHRELLDGRLCRPDSEQRPLVRNFTTVAIVKLCCHNFTQIANFMIFFCVYYFL